MASPTQTFNDVVIEEKCRAQTVRGIDLIAKDFDKLEKGEAVNYERMLAVAQVIEALANHIGGDAYDAADGFGD